tara:strand:- start:992 stop:1411 length:420 start_codon:yes stop_codon:yes gene_type:complete
MPIYASQFNRLGKNIEKGINNVVKAVGVAVSGTVVKATPVLTGRARSNWIVTLGSPSVRTVPTYGPGTTAIAGALAQGRGVIAGRQLGQSIHVTNNLPYIGVLNTGTSTQAASGFIETAIQAGVFVAASQAAGIIRRSL